MPTARRAENATAATGPPALGLILASRYAGKKGLHSCSPSPKNSRDTSTMPTVRLTARMAPRER
jgi:hypothetical protein